MFIELLLQLLPVILQLFNKSKEERDDAVVMGKVMQKAAMKTESWEGIFLGGIVQRIGKMNDEQQAQVVRAFEGAIAAKEAYEAKAAKGGEA